jgi:hypothetical protein
MVAGWLRLTLSHPDWLVWGMIAKVIGLDKRGLSEVETWRNQAWHFAWLSAATRSRSQSVAFGKNRSF